MIKVASSSGISGLDGSSGGNDDDDSGDEYSMMMMITYNDTIHHLSHQSYLSYHLFSIITYRIS